MPVTTDLVAKKAARNSVSERYNFPKKLKHLGIVSFADPLVREFVAAGLSAIGMGAVVLGGPLEVEHPYIFALDRLTHDELLGFDFFVTDGESDLSIMDYMRAGLVPVLPRDNVFSELMSEFDPMKFEGNAFLFADTNPYRIFEKIIAYKENVKFPEDRRVLLRNIENTF